MTSEIADEEHRRQLEKMQAMDGLRSETLIASVDSENAALLVDLKKQEFNSISDTERKEMYEKLTDAERAKG